MLVTYIPNHVEQAEAQLMEQYQGLPLFNGLLAALVDQIQDLENAAYNMVALTQLFNNGASGQQLDNIGQIVGRARDGLSDAEYYVFLRAQISENFSQTTIQELVTLVQNLFNPTLLLAFEMFPAEMDFEVGGATLDPSLYQQASALIQGSMGGGIGLGFVAVGDPSNAFRMSDLNGNLPNGTGGGFSDATNPSFVGGVFAGIVFNNAAA